MNERAYKNQQDQGLEYVTCNLCGSCDYITLYEMRDVKFHPDETFRAVRCKDCTLGYLNPRPNQAAIDKYYPKGFFDHIEEQATDNIKRYRRGESYIRRHLDLPNNRKPKLLDVGCANGGFPHYMKDKGWDVEGLEISSEAREIKDFKVYNTILPNLPIDNPSYDAVTAWAVLEHVHDPMSYFRKASTILRPGGVFAFLVTNVDSLSSYGLYREDLPRHTYYFNKPTIERYLKKNGLRLVETCYGKDIYQMKPVGWLIYKLNHLLGRPPLALEEFPQTRQAWLNDKGLKNSVINSLRYSVSHPIVILDRLLLPLYEQWQILTKTYGITTYVAKKD